VERTDEPKRRGRKPKTDTPRLGFEMFADVAAHLRDLQGSVRLDAGHVAPSQRTLVSALILNETRRGEELERDLLVPFRLAHPEAE
jgi:hypothetical protein